MLMVVKVRPEFISLKPTAVLPECLIGKKEPVPLTCDGPPVLASTLGGKCAYIRFKI